MKRLTLTLIGLFIAFFPHIALSHGEETHDPIIIQITDEGFNPSELTVTVGETVTFENDGQRDHWPASDVHPTHEEYPAFDPKKPLIPNSSWSFTFDEIGEWSMHDHLDSSLTGTIVVVPESEKSFVKVIIDYVRNIFKKLFDSKSNETTETESTDLASTINTVYKEPKEYDLNSVDENLGYSCDSTNHACISNTLEGIVADVSPVAATHILERMIVDGRVSRSVNDHQLAHEIGRNTARVYGVNINSFLLCPTSEFNGGCQHGFFEYVLGRTDTATEAANLICQSLGDEYSSKFKFYCYHGVGHGVMMQQAYDLQASLDICDTFEEFYAQDGCWQGVFMENVNAVTSEYAVREGVFSEEDPLAPCNVVENQYRNECYLNHAGYLVGFFQQDIIAASEACLEAGEWTSSCIQSLGLMISNPSWQPAIYDPTTSLSEEEISWELCRQFPQNVIDMCVKGAIDNINNFDEFEMTRADTFCGLVDSEYQESCWIAIGNNLNNIALSDADVEASCTMLRTEAQALCLSVIQ